VNEGRWFAIIWMLSLLLSTAFLAVIVWAIITLVGWVVGQ